MQLLCAAKDVLPSTPAGLAALPAGQILLAWMAFDSMVSKHGVEILSSDQMVDSLPFDLPQLQAVDTVSSLHLQLLQLS